jgi:hypothetical protein
MKFQYAVWPLAASAAVIDMPKGLPKDLENFDCTSVKTISESVLTNIIVANFMDKMSFLKSYSGVVVETTRLPSIRNDTIHKAIRYGPFTVPSQKDAPQKSIFSALASQLGPGFPAPEKGELNAFGKVDALCTDCFVIRSTTYMQYENGTLATPATGIYNHHAVIFQSDQKPMYASCDTKSFSRAQKSSSIFAASAADGGSIEALTKIYPQDYSTAVKRGLYTRPNAKMSMLAQLMNYRDEAQKIYIIAEAEYLPGKPEGYFESTGVQISVTGCDKKIDFDLPDGKYSKTSPEYIVPKDIQLVSMGGHMHDGGDNMELFINGKTACVSKAVYGIDGQILTDQNGNTASSIVGMKPCVTPIQLKKGDRLSVTANYDRSVHPM